MTDRLQEAVARLIDHYDLPRAEVWDLLFEEDYPPLLPGDLGEYHEHMLRLAAEDLSDL